MAEQHLQSEERSIRKNFHPAMEVREAMREDPGGSRKGLVKKAKTRIVESDNETRVATLLNQQR